MGTKAKYIMVATVAVPKLAREEEELQDPGELHQEEEDLPVLELGEDPPPVEEDKEEDVRALHHAIVGRLHQGSGGAGGRPKHHCGRAPAKQISAGCH